LTFFLTYSLDSFCLSPQQQQYAQREMGILLKKTINIGIVAHVDAGKTSLTERILYEMNVIDEIGRVDKGNTQTDSLELEKRRGITIKASVVSFFVNDLKINLIDTPGHPDFIAEVERSFSVLVLS